MGWGAGQGRVLTANVLLVSMFWGWYLLHGLAARGWKRRHVLVDCCGLNKPLDTWFPLNSARILDPLNRFQTLRKDKAQIYTFINAFLNQYDNEDFDLGIKQFLIEQVCLV